MVSLNRQPAGQCQLHCGDNSPRAIALSSSLALCQFCLNEKKPNSSMGSDAAAGASIRRKLFQAKSSLHTANGDTIQVLSEEAVESKSPWPRNHFNPGKQHPRSGEMFAHDNRLTHSADLAPVTPGINSHRLPAHTDSCVSVRLGNYVTRTPYHDGTFIRWKGKLGEGAFNEVWAAEFLVGDKHVEVAVKFPSNAISRTAAKLGIPHHRPDFALRNIAMSQINRKLGWRTVPDTELCRLNGKTGIVMTLANGRSPAAESSALRRTNDMTGTLKDVDSIWRLMQRIGSGSSRSLEQIHKSLLKLGLQVVYDRNGKPSTYSLPHPLPRLRHPLGKTELVKLQILDLLCAQADRHANNYLVDENEQRHVVVQGIDNDQSFGSNITRLDKIIDQQWANLAGLPDVVDTAIYGAIMRLGAKDIAELLDKLLPAQEIEATQMRLRELQQHLIRLRHAGRVINPEEWDRVRPDELGSSYFAMDYC